MRYRVGPFNFPGNCRGVERTDIYCSDRKKIEFESTLVQEVDESLLRWNIKLFTSKCERSIYFQFTRNQEL